MVLVAESVGIFPGAPTPSSAAGMLSSQAMSQRQGEYAATAKEVTKKNLLQIQQRDGSWYARNGNERGAGRIYATSMALLSLSVHHHYLPIYQR